MTTLQQRRTFWTTFRQELATLAFITRGGNWLFLLMSRLAEMLMFLSVLYVIAETVVPGVFKAPAPACHMVLHHLSCPPAPEIPLFATISSICIVVLNTAPEVILPGCFLQARTAEKQQARMYQAMGVVFILLTFVTLASFIWGFTAGVIAVILFFRCAAGVVYSLLVRISPQSVTLPHQQHQAQLDEVTGSFNQQVQRLTEQLSRIEESFHQRLNESSTILTQSFQQELSKSQESFHQYQNVLALVPTMKAQLSQIESSTAAELHQIKTSLEQQAQSQMAQPQQRTERPTLRALPHVTQSDSDTRRTQTKEAHQPTTQAISGKKFDARSFVFSCLKENPDLKLSEIEQRAKEQGQELSQPTISRYRKQFITSSESSTVVENESSTESPDESFVEHESMQAV